MAPGVILLVLTACSNSPTSQPDQASMIRIAFKEGDSYRYHYRSALQATMTMGQGAELPIKVDASADATWKVVSVDANGVTTVDLTMTNLKTTFTGSFPPGSTTTSTTTTTTQHIEFQVAPTGEIVSGGGPSGPPSVFSMAQGLGPPGTDQFLAILPGHTVKPGDTWTKSFTRPNPSGQGSMTYTTENRFLRYDNLKSGRAAVIQTTATVPLDVTIDLQKVMSATGGLASPPPLPIAAPVSGQVHIQGTSSTDTTTWFDVRTDQVEKMTTVDSTDETTTFLGFSGLPTPSVPPALQGPPPPLPQGLFGPQHFVGRQTLEFDRIP
ncbi:MAG TPA: hypothetical protein VKF14_04680 [Candidatus Dormibacteraeota bacterium]|nr:hypothetical protein [Candidatus Dormibacteraeota bacterium]